MRKLPDYEKKMRRTICISDELWNTMISRAYVCDMGVSRWIVQMVRLAMVAELDESLRLPDRITRPVTAMPSRAVRAPDRGIDLATAPRMPDGKTIDWDRLRREREQST